MNSLIEFREDEGLFADERYVSVEQLEREYDRLDPAEKLEWWIEYLGREKAYGYIVDLIFEDGEKYGAEDVIESLENFYDKDEMISWKWRNEV